MACYLNIGTVNDELTELMKELDNHGLAYSKQQSWNSEKNKWLSINVSDVDFDNFRLQQEEATAFLQNHLEYLKTLLSYSYVEGALLDFGIEKRDVAVQREIIQPQLIKLSGEIGLTFAIALFEKS